MQIQRRLSTQAINLFKKAKTNELSRSESEELHFDLLRVVKGFHMEIKHNVLINEEFDVVVHFPNYQQIPGQFDYSMELSFQGQLTCKILLSFVPGTGAFIAFDLFTLSEAGVADDFSCVIHQDLEGKRMTDMPGESDKTSSYL